MIPLERFWPKVTMLPDGCWEWKGHHDRDGYSIWQYSHTKNLRAHRWIYEKLVGPIPAGLTIDHLCRNRGCVNPDHMEPVTGAENVRRARTTACKYGHPWTPENTGVWITPAGYEHRRCRTCDARRHRERAA